MEVLQNGSLGQLTCTDHANALREQLFDSLLPLSCLVIHDKRLSITMPAQAAIELTLRKRIFNLFT